MLDKWVTGSLLQFAMIGLSCVTIYAAILVYTRLVGLRSFSKMSSADFAMTVAVGSVFGATVSNPNPTIFIGGFALLMLFAGQWSVAKLRRKSDLFAKVVDNQPLLLMAGSTILDENLQRANVTRADLFGKLREANALNYDQVLAVVFETTGDISVLHSSEANATLSPDFFSGVEGASELFGPDAMRGS